MSRCVSISDSHSYSVLGIGGEVSGIEVGRLCCACVGRGAGSDSAMEVGRLVVLWRGGSDRERSDREGGSGMSMKSWLYDGW
jgi:hypothetical protein